MPLFTRITDIVSANLNELVDRYEDPERMLQQAIREMESSLAAAMDSAAKVIAGERLLERQIHTQRQHADQWKQQAVNAVAAGDDQQARASLAHKLHHEQLADSLSTEQTAAQEASQSLRGQIDAMRIRLAEARRQLATLIARRRAALARKDLATQFGTRCLDSESFTRFDRLRDKLELQTAEADAYLELTGCDTSDLHPEAPQSLDAHIDAELQQLKQTHTPS